MPTQFAGPAGTCRIQGAFRPSLLNTHCHIARSIARRHDCPGELAIFVPAFHVGAGSIYLVVGCHFIQYASGLSIVHSNVARVRHKSLTQALCTLHTNVQ